MIHQHTYLHVIDNSGESTAQCFGLNNKQFSKLNDKIKVAIKSGKHVRHVRDLIITSTKSYSSYSDGILFKSNVNSGVISSNNEFPFSRVYGGLTLYTLSRYSQLQNLSNHVEI